jgi:hypothetical protein
MALNNIQLNSSHLTDMYRNSLVDMKMTQEEGKFFSDQASINKEVRKPDSFSDRVAADSSRAEWKYLGEYKKNILLIVRYADATYLPDEQLNFLTSILGACKLNLGDVAIVNLVNVPSAFYKTVQERFKSTAIILFGLTPQEFEMPVNFPEFQVQAFNNCSFLHTPGLEALETDKILKSKLWVCLRRMFDLP